VKAPEAGFLPPIRPETRLAIHEKEKGAIGRGKRTPILTALLPELWIKRLEVNDLNFELVFPECLRQDGSGQKGFEAFDQNFVFHVERESPRSFPQKCACFRHRVVSWQVTIFFE